MSSSDWPAKLGVVELVRGRNRNVGCGAVVTGWKHRNHRILWHSSAGTGGTDELMDETEMWFAVLSSLFGSAEFCGVAPSSCAGTHGTV